MVAIVLAVVVVGGAFALGHARASSGSADSGNVQQLVASVRKLQASNQRLQMKLGAEDAAVKGLQAKISFTQSRVRKHWTQFVTYAKGVNAYAKQINAVIRSLQAAQDSGSKGTGSPDVHICPDGSVVASNVACGSPFGP